MVAQESGVVYRYAVRVTTTTLGQLAAVYGDNPDATLDAYLRHIGAKLVERPVRLPDMKPGRHGIDQHIGPKDGAPGYQLLNRLEIHWLDRGLMGEP